MYGVVLTHTDSVDTLLQKVHARGMNAVKVIPSWGLQHGWNDASIYALVHGIDHVIVRTTSGDPSNMQTSWYLEPTYIRAELAPFLRYRRNNVWVELGNEPDLHWDHVTPTDNDIWQYRFFLEDAITMLRKDYPSVKLIAPSPRVNSYVRWYRWIEIMADQLQRCDALSAHVYGWHWLTTDRMDKADFIALQERYLHHFGMKDVIITEAGIHDETLTPEEKFSRYDLFRSQLPSNWCGFFIYHYNSLKDLHPEYAVMP